jgi:outer membrane protein assembly factor BamA
MIDLEKGYYSLKGENRGATNAEDSRRRLSTATEARKITSFTTAAYDPVWTDEDDLICAVFDNYRFQIRKVNHIDERYDSTDTAKIFDYVAVASDSLHNGGHWRSHGIPSMMGLNTADYQRQYDLDIAQSQISTDPVFGTSGGAVVALSDLLGNDQYYFLIYNTAQTKDEILKSFNIAISRVSLGQRTNYAYGIFHFSGPRYDLTDPDLFFYERVFGGYFAYSYPLSKFRRIEASISLSNSGKETYTGIGERKALLLSNSISYVKDNSIWSPTGPIDGDRFNFTLAFTTDIQYSNVNYYTIIADYRRYFRLGTRTAYAARAQLFYNEGKEARRFFMGGSWDLRGYPRWSLRGKKLWLTSHELRFPLIDAIGVKFPFGGIGFGAIRGASFFDVGAVWDDVYTETLGSLGVGLRVNILGVLVLRYDFGKLIERNFTKLSDDFFHQFFFGWDF